LLRYCSYRTFGLTRYRLCLRPSPPLPLTFAVSLCSDSVIPACGLDEEMLTSVVLDFAEFDLSIE
jgi:hypothetical protein